MSVTTSSVDYLEDIAEVEDYDSCLFESIDVDEPKKELVLKAIQKYEDLVSADNPSDPSLYCKLGHLHLLLEDFNKALSAYNTYFQLEKEYWKNSSFLFGFGIACFHFSAYPWSIQLFQNLLYNDPGFIKANEVHCRLGLLFKITGNHQSAIKHFNHFLSDHRSSSASQSEVRFHLGHLFEIQKKPVEACQEYERVIELPETQVKKAVLADSYRQLGWLYHTSDALGDPAQRNHTALRYLQRSIETDPNNGQTWYFLGRYYSSMGKVHDAFVSYRQSIDKSEASADTWCSIGVLYQEQNQPMDALQAYICAVQLDRSHTAAWKDLAVLYEACQQPKDALVCYLNCQHCMKTKEQSEGEGSLQERIKYLQEHVTGFGSETSNKGRILPCIEDAWTLPIPAELTQRQSAFKCPPSSQNPKLSASSPSNLLTTKDKAPMTSSTDATNLASLPGASLSTAANGCDSRKPPSKRQKLDSTVPQKPRLAPFWYLTTQQIKVLNNLKLNRSILNPNQKMELERLEHSHSMMMKHQKAIKEAEELAARHSLVDFNSSELVHPSTAVSSSSVVNGVNTNPVWTAPPFSNTSVSSSSNHCSAPTSVDVLPTSIHLKNGDVLSKTLNEKFIKELPRGQLINCDGALSPALSTSSVTFSPERNKQLSNGPVFSDHSSKCSKSAHNNAVSDVVGASDKCNCVVDTSRVTYSQGSVTSPSVVQTQSKLTNHVTTHTPAPVASSSAPPPELNGMSTDSLSCSPLQEAVNENQVDEKSLVKKERSLSEIPGRDLPPILMPAGISEDLPARDVITLCRKLTCNGLPAKHLFLNKCPPPCRPKRQTAVIPKDELCPSAPTIYLENKKEAMSRALADFCTNPSNPVTVIRGLASALKLDLGLFSTKTLVESNPEWEVEVRTQLQQPSEENWDSTFTNRVWLCESSRSFTSIAKYAQYQASTFREALQDEEAKRSNPSGAGCTSKKSDTNDKSGPKINFKTIKFGTNIDLSNEKKWRPQLQELSKLPWLFRLVSAGNMLSHVGHNILGMNTVQLYMKVPGSRTPGHQENNNYCAININIGPGDCEWFAVPEEYWGEIDELCERNNINYLSGSWWPVLEDLYQANIPVYRFIQKPGDLVWLNSGTVHWVQAVLNTDDHVTQGWCNNIAWNVGPVSAYQYQMSVERYEWNKLAGYKSIVPLLQLTWSMAQHVRITEKPLFTMMKTCMMRTMWQCQQILDDLKKKNIDVIWHGRNENEPSHYCESCDVEVFNLLFVRRSDNLQTHLVHCLNCARSLNSNLDNFVVLNQYHADELMRIYDQFTLAKKSKT